MLDTHFMLGLSRFAIAADPDLLNAFSQLLAENGACDGGGGCACECADSVKNIAADQVHIGDWKIWNNAAETNEAEVLICNSHGQETALRLGIPLLRAGFPQYDLLGGYQRQWIGYTGTRQTLFDIANILLSLEKGEIHPYQSIYAQKQDKGVSSYGGSDTAAHSSRTRH